MTPIHHHDHAALVIEGNIDWSCSHALLDAIETSVAYFGYELIEIAVDSPGGNARPLRQVLDFLDTYRAKGVRFRTRVRSNASSAGAILVAMGDERVASPDARLLFHGSRVYRRGKLTARQCAELHAVLSRSDSDAIWRLVDRAFATQHPEPVHEAEACDREVLERLCSAVVLALDETAPARVHALVMALGRTVDGVLERGDREGLEGVYRRLFEIDRPISARLAKTLLLVDRVADTAAGPSLDPGTALLSVPAWRALHPPDGAISTEALTRHTLIVGGDLAEATRCAIAPVVSAIASAPVGTFGPVLVLGPDPELRAMLASIAKERPEVPSERGLLLDLMSGPGHALDPHLEAGQWMSAATQILKRTLALVPASPARFLLDASGRVPDMVLKEGTQVVLSLLALVLMLTSRYSSRPQGWLPEDRDARWLLSALIEHATGTDIDPGPNALATVSFVLDSVSGRTASLVAEAASDSFGRNARQEREIVQGLVSAADALSAARGHARSVLEVAQAICGPLASDAARTRLYFGCEPGLVRREALDLRALVADTSSVIVHDPREDDPGQLVARALKHLYFEAVLDRLDGGSDPVPCGYVAQGFERFASPIDGEFLDRAGSGGFAVLASRSAGTIERAVADVPGVDFQTLLSAFGTTIFLRSTDPLTRDLLRALSPRRPDLPAVVDVRPLSSLAPNECYASFGDLRFVRARIVPATGPGGGDPVRPKAVVTVPVEPTCTGEPT